MKIFKYIDDILLLLGCICILVGIRMISVIATWITGGLMMIGWGVLIAYLKKKIGRAK